MSTLTDLSEVVKLAAADTIFYGHYFFNRTFRQDSPQFHYDICAKVEDPSNRCVAIKVYRDGAKTTLLRCIASKRIAYALSRTIVLVSASQGHSVRSLRWLKKQVEHNHTWKTVYGLRPGTKWTDEEIQIINDVEGVTITVVAIGITGQTRGINIDDYRPDFILIDDCCDEENTRTKEARQKTEEFIFGSLLRSLAPRSENPDAKLVILQTPLNREDVIEKAMKDKQFAVAEYSCFDERGESRWAARKSTNELQLEKEAYIGRNQLSLWMREMEVRVTSPELSAFHFDWLQFYEVLPEAGAYYIGIDPTPPPRKGTDGSAIISSRADDAAIVVIKVSGGKIYLADYYITKSPSPEELLTKIFQMIVKYPPMGVGFESLVFARTMQDIIEREMHRRQHFFPLVSVEDKRHKDVRIRQALTGRASQRTIYVHQSHRDFIDQFSQYPDVAHDDILDAFAIALGLINPYIETESQMMDYKEQEKAIPDLRIGGGCP